MGRHFNISAGVKESWENPKTREERLTRHGVEVYDGVVFVGKFTSTYQAFVALDLPINKHIPFRGKLKKAGKLYFQKYTVKTFPL